MKILNTLALVLFSICMINAQTVWTGTVDTDWNNSDNWNAGVPTSGQTATISGGATNQPTYAGSTVLDITVENAGILTFNTIVYNVGAIINFGGATIINDNQIINAGTITFDNDGILNNNGTFDNYGVYDHAASAILNNAAAGTFNSYGSFSSNGQINNDGLLNIDGDFSNSNGMVNNGTFTLSGMASLPFGSSLTTGVSSVIEVEPTGTLDINGNFTNQGNVLVDGMFAIQSAAVVNNTATITNNNDLDLGGQLINDGTVANNGTLNISSSGLLENNSTLNNSSTITLEICGKLIQNAGNNIGGSILNEGLVFEITGTVNETNGEFGETFTDLASTPAPIPACKGGVVFELDETGNVSFTADAIDQGRSYGSCGATLVDYAVSPSSFTTADIGTQIVTLTITDNFGVSSSCEDFVAVIAYQPPVVPVDDPDITFTCPSNITVTTEPGAQFAPASWTTPTATTTCAPSGGGADTDCTQLPSSLTGFTLIGDFNGSRYFVSNTNDSWNDANAIAQANGGNLATITSQEENDFIQNGINPASGSVWTGLNTVSSPGVFNWTTGEPLDYTNWNSGEPNGNGIDYGVRMLNSNGLWTDRPIADHYEFVVEIACPNECTLPGSISGFTLIGDLNDSRYFVSNTNDSWNDANAIAQANGGNLATITSQEENDFIQNGINPASGSVWTGLNTVSSPGVFNWTTGEPLDYTNWNSGEPNGTGIDYGVRMLNSTGLWTDRPITDHYEFVIEIPCPEACTDVNLTFVFDNYPEDISWTINDGDGNSVASGGNYGAEPDGSTLIEMTCLIDGCYDLVINDSYGDGLCCAYGNGSYSLTNADGAVLASGATFTTQDVNNFCIESGGESGGGGNGDPELTVTLIAGPLSGSNFPEGVTELAYEITDACGNLEVCTFDVTVDAVPAEFMMTDCPTDITTDAAPGATSATVSWAAPGGTSDCFREGPIGTEQTIGLDNGSEFPIGTSGIGYAVFDSCGNFASCLFNVSVNFVPATLTVANCPADITETSDPGSGGMVLNWTTPTGSSNCYLGSTASVTQISGPTSGSFIPNGNTQVIYLISDDCVNTQLCIFNINIADGGLCVNNGGDADGDNVCADVDCDDNDPTIPATPGTTCDDGDADTENDVIGTDGCSCAGTPIVNCDNNGGDADGDGICADVDCDDNDASVVPLPEGTACNDGDPATQNDVIGADGCTCAGALPVDIILTDLTVNEGITPANIDVCIGSVSNQDVSVTYITTSGTAAASGDFGFGIGTITIPAGDLCISIAVVIIDDGEEEGDETFTLDFSNPVNAALPDNQLEVTIQDNDGANPCDNNGGDADGDGFCADVDCDDNDAAVIPQTAGTTCDDGDATTENDIIGADGCSCAGTPIDPCDANGGDADGDGFCADVDCDDNDAAVIPQAAGTTCDDGDATTENDIIGTDGCSCAGTPIDPCDANGGDADGDGFCADVDCDDNDAAVIPQAAGTTCDDGDADTENDVIGVDGCSCAGTPIETGCNPMYSVNGNDLTVTGLNGAHNSVKVFDTGNGWATIFNCLDDCGNPAVINLPEGNYYLNIQIFNASWQTECTLQEYFDVTGGCSVGASCNDGDACTDNDVYDADCNCVGTFSGDVDGDGTCANEDCDDSDASLPAAPGTTCDDGDADTENDVIGADGCSCAGTPIGGACDNNGGDADGDGYCADVDCDDNDAAVIPQTAGTTCNDGDANTENDVIGADGCACEGTPIATGCNPLYSVSGNDVTVTGLNGAHNSIKIFDTGNGWATVYECFDNCQSVITLPDGDYYIQLKVYNSSYQTECEFTEYFTIDGGGAACTPGTSCNDNDVCTDNDVYDTDCNCAGTYSGDADGDGVCANEDCDDNDGSLPTAQGTICDDGNPETEGDVIQSDGCTCLGEVPSDCDIAISTGPGSITIDGLTGANVIVHVFNSSWSSVFDCLNDCDNPHTVSGLANDTYFVRATNYDSGWSKICEVDGYYTVTGGTGLEAVTQPEFLFFNATKDGREVSLNWTTNTEYKNSYFVIERSVDGIDFNSIKDVESIDDSNNAINYQDRDAAPFTGTNFYRLKEVFNTGEYRYSAIEVVVFDIDVDVFALYPNPTASQVFVSLKEFAGKSATIQVVNNLGQLMQVLNVSEISSQAIGFDVSTYPSGMYGMSIKVEGRKLMTNLFVVSKL